MVVAVRVALLPGLGGLALVDADFCREYAFGVPVRRVGHADGAAVLAVVDVGGVALRQDQRAQGTLLLHHFCANVEEKVVDLVHALEGRGLAGGLFALKLFDFLKHGDGHALVVLLCLGVPHEGTAPLGAVIVVAFFALVPLAVLLKDALDDAFVLSRCADVLCGGDADLQAFSIDEIGVQPFLFHVCLDGRVGGQPILFDVKVRLVLRVVLDANNLFLLVQDSARGDDLLGRLLSGKVFLCCLNLRDESVQRIRINVATLHHDVDEFRNGLHRACFGRCHR